jgi:hypothetical protein
MNKLLISGVCVIGVVAAGLILLGQNRIGLAADELQAQWHGYPRLSPFQEMRWTPQVRVGGNWYELLAVNDVTVDQIRDYCRSIDDFNWQKHFGEDMVEILTKMGHAPGATADLKLKSLSTGEVTTMNGVPMTEANRAAILHANAG